MKYECTTACYVSDKRGNVRCYKVGELIDSKKYEGLKQTQKNKFRRYAPARIQKPWLKDELKLIAKAYLKYAVPSENHDARGIIGDEYCANFTRHSREECELVVRRIVAADSFYDARGMSSMTKQLYEVLENLAPGRFTNNSLDKLLVAVRAM